MSNNRKLCQHLGADIILKRLQITQIFLLFVLRTIVIIKND